MVERGDPSSTKEIGCQSPTPRVHGFDVQTFRDFDSQLPYHARWGTLLENEWRGKDAVCLYKLHTWLEGGVVSSRM